MTQVGTNIGDAPVVVLTIKELSVLVNTHIVESFYIEQLVS